MARISTTIDAEDFDDYQRTLRLMAGNAGSARGASAEESASHTVEEQYGEEQATTQRRTRRTKAQIEADAAAAKAEPEAVKTAILGNDVPDDLASQIKLVQAQEAAETQPTIDALKAAMSAHMAAKDAKATQDLLLKTTGAARVSEVDPSKYAAAIAAFQADT